MSEEIGCCRSSSSSSPEDDDDLLWEILLRLPSLPSSLPRASAVCKRWRRLVTDPIFLRSFRDHHRKEGPPILGFFEYDFGDQEMLFHPILDPPDSAPLLVDGRYVLGCRHGLVFTMDRDHERWELIVCAPVTGEQQRVPIPSEFNAGSFIGTVMCVASEHGHVHGACHVSNFKAVLVSPPYFEDDPTVARVYSSATGAWGNIISTHAHQHLKFKVFCPALLLGSNTLYWLSDGDAILELDFEEQSLAVINVPPGTGTMKPEHRQIILAADEGTTIGFAVLSYPCLQMWQRNISSRGVAAWVPWKTLQINDILGLPQQIDSPRMKTILHYEEDNDAIFISVDVNVYMVQLNSMQSKIVYTTEDRLLDFHPFKSFYPPGSSITGDGAEILHDK